MDALLKSWIVEDHMGAILLRLLREKTISLDVNRTPAFDRLCLGVLERSGRRKITDLQMLEFLAKEEIAAMRAERRPAKRPARSKAARSKA
jgi:hypothetical protein